MPRKAMGHPVDAHLKIDTGMSRLGVRPAGLVAFAEALRAIPGEQIRIKGLMTHLACAESDDGYTADQLARFEEATTRLASFGIEPAIRHAANSAAVLRGEALFDAVRPGISIFGVSPTGAPIGELHPAMHVRSEIVDLRTIDSGESVGYGATFRASRTTRIATLPMGYADGLSRQLSNCGHVLVRGVRAPIVGAVSMDMCMIDVTDVPGVGLRDEITVLGGKDNAREVISAEEIAQHSGSIAWEVLTSISRRVPRFYREP